ncbi:p-hydroxyphenylacetate 3-hydroxylase reductase component [Gynuella sunshinyii]|nr:flavin reductase family protein [Gynuella sunshinyii]
MSQQNTFDNLAFRRALGNFATGITVVTATSASTGQRVGVTANSFNSVSLEPPLILWSIDKKSSSFPVFEQASHFAVNILAADQMPLSNHFAKRSEDKFADVGFTEGPGRAPILPDCAAVFLCERHACLEGGDHWILIGRVVGFEDSGRAPLLYHQGSYSLVMPFARKNGEMAGQPLGDDHEHPLQHYLYYLMLQATRSYQQHYQPRQLATGLRTAEARILLSLASGRRLNHELLAAEVNMPEQDMQSAFELLQAKSFIQCQDGQFELQPAGADMAETLWQIAVEEQQQRFSQFSTSEIATFKKVLLALIQNQTSV